MRPRRWSRIDVSYAFPGPLLYPVGVGLCWLMKLYQSATHTAPSGPTMEDTGLNHSSAPETRFHPSFVTYPAPCDSTMPWPVRCAVGSLMNAMRFQYSFGNARAV